MKRIYFTVTNDLSYDQRMQRICGSLAAAGFKICLVGRKLPYSIALEQYPYEQKRIYCWFKRSKWFYAEYNIRLFFFLLFRRMDAICAIDLDTILPCYHISRLKKIPRIYDAHELFTELKEVISREAVHRTWLRVEKKMVPKFRLGYTVSKGIAEEFNRRYGVTYLSIPNMPVLEPLQKGQPNKRLLLYQGAVNEARGLEHLVPAMHFVDAELLICGDGNYMTTLKELIQKEGLQDKIRLTGMLTPVALKEAASHAYVAIAVPDKEGLNQYLALPNKWFDYIHAGLPQVTMNYPEYLRYNQELEVAVLLEDNRPETIARALNNLLSDGVLYERLRANCLLARERWNWQLQEEKLIRFYQSIFNS